MICVRVVECPKCGDAMYPRCESDTQRCTCTSVGIEWKVGGGTSLYISPDLRVSPQTYYIQIPATERSLQEDFYTSTDIYGHIVAEHGPGSVRRKRVW